MSQFKYLELEHLLRKDIKANHFLPSGKLPSVRDMCQNLGVSKATVLPLIFCRRLALPMMQITLSL